MKKYLLVSVKVLFVSILIFSCKSVSFSELRPEGSLVKKLPMMEAQLDIYSLENAYASVVYGVSKTVAQRVVPINEARPSSYKDTKIQDAIILYDREVSDNIVSATGEKKGYLVFRIISGGPKKGGNFFGVLGIFTLWIPNLLGVPTGNHQAEFEIQLEVMDINKKMLGKYLGYGKHKTWVHVGGYSTKDAQRIANIRALKKAFSQVKKQMDEDMSKLEVALQGTPQ